LAEIPEAPELDGVNLIPHLTGEDPAPPHQTLYWRWISQSAIREGDWKLLRGDKREYLYHLAEDKEEKQNLIDQHPELANRLRSKLRTWTQTLKPPGLATKPMVGTWNEYFDYYLEGKPAPPLPQKFRKPSTSPSKRPTAQQISQLRDRNNDAQLTLKELIGDPKGRNAPDDVLTLQEWLGKPSRAN